MAEKFESNIVTYTALLSHQQRLRKKDHNPKEIKGKVLGVREQRRSNDTQRGTILTINVDMDKKQAYSLVNKIVVIHQDNKNHVK